MSQPKEPIPIAKIQQLAEMLAVLHDAALKSATEFKASGLESTDVEGWKTLAKGLLFTQRILKKISSPASPVQRLDVDAILLPHHKSKKAKRAEEKKADLAKLDEAEAKLKELQRKRTPRST